MAELWAAIQRLSPGRKIAVYLMLSILGLTWIAVCVVMASILV